jgi:lipopolysaccharide biosynthesis protein
MEDPMTTDSYELPELPEAPFFDFDDDGVQHLTYTADQMRAYATQAVLAERERCIAACRKVRQDLDEYAERNNYHGDAWEYIDKCEAAIRKG